MIYAYMTGSARALNEYKQRQALLLVHSIEGREGKAKADRMKQAGTRTPVFVCLGLVRCSGMAARASRGRRGHRLLMCPSKGPERPTGLHANMCTHDKT